MGLFSGLEGSLEKYIEGFFKDKVSGPVQPADIAKKLAREMRDRRRVSISSIYVPNEYTVFLSHTDWEGISAFSGALADELQGYVSRKAAEKKYSLTGRPLIKFVADGHIAAAGMVVDSCFSGVPPEEEKVDAQGASLEYTQHFKPVKDKPLSDAQPLPGAKIRVESGPDRDKIFNLNKVSVVIGRRAGCDIAFSDDSISRRHARIDLHRGVYTIHDLGSTNGIKVNGDKITAKELNSGDVLTLGATVCTFKVE